MGSRETRTIRQNPSVFSPIQIDRPNECCGSHRFHPRPVAPRAIHPGGPSRATLSGVEGPRLATRTPRAGIPSLFTATDDLKAEPRAHL
jgi:hypothetical protein